MGTCGFDHRLSEAWQQEKSSIGLRDWWKTLGVTFVNAFLEMCR